MRSIVNALCIAAVVFLSFSAPAYAGTLEGLNAAAFVPAPNLRIEAKGILGSDGTLFEIAMITAKLPGDKLVTQATTELTYIEYGKKRIDASSQRNVIRYVPDQEGISRQAVVERRTGETGFWLPSDIEIGRQWEKTSKRNGSEIMARDLTVETAAGRFEGCIMVERGVYAAAVGVYQHYFAPGVGLVKTVALRRPTDTRGATWYEVQRVEKMDEAAAMQAVEQMKSWGGVVVR